MRPRVQVSPLRPEKYEGDRGSPSYAPLHKKYMGLRGKRPGGPYILRAARRRGCASKAQDKVSPRGKAPGRFWPPYAGGHSYAWEVSATDHTGFSKVSHFAGQNGTGYAARAYGRGRARCAGRAEPAHGRGYVGRNGALVAALLGAPPPCPPIYVPASGASEAKPTAAGDAEHPFDDGMTTHDTQKPVKDSTRLRHAPKAFFFGAPHPFLWARPKKWGGTWVAGT